MFELPINEEVDNRENRKKVLGIVLDILDKNDVKYNIDTDNKTRYLASIPNLIGETDLYITTNINDNREICKQANFKIAKYNALLTHNNLNILKLTVADEMPYEESNTEYDDECMNTKIDLKTLLDNQDHKRILLSSDWHFFQTHYKHEANPVNTQKIVAWCKDNIKDDDIFMYLGDISFRYANKQDQEESQKILKSIPGIKVLIIGNHDGMLGQEYFTGCGFDYVFEEFTWNNYIFTHRPINMSIYPDGILNIHGHIHKWPKYNTTDGKRNINVYPWYFNNKPVTLDYIEHHVEDLVKDHEWNKSYMLGESTIEADELVDTILSNLRILTKQTKSLEETKRSELPDSAFGIPEDRKYPLDTEQHVRSAIKLFGHAEESKKKELAKRIKRAADKYDIEIPETTQVYKYLHESVFDNELVLSEIMTDINNSLNEAVLKTKPDIKYNLDKFESGEITLALIVGYSGGGKSTLGRNMADSDKIEHIELDDINYNFKFSDKNLKQYNDLVYSFFNTKGKKYRVSYQYLVDNKVDEKDYEIPLMNDFISYAIQYCKSSKKTKYVIEGIWPLLFDINPSKFDNICVLIKGTSYLKSSWRAGKRDEDSIPKAIKLFIERLIGKDNAKYRNNINKNFEKYYKYFSDKVKDEELIKESSIEYNKVPINQNNINKYKEKCSALKHIKDDAKGYIYLDNDQVVALIAVNDKDNEVWITALEVFGPNKGKGLSYKLLDIATKEFKATKLSVRKTNNIAIHIYKKYGFKIYDETDYMYFMSLEAIKESANVNTKILNGYTVKDIQDFFDSIPKGDPEYGSKHKDYKETIYRNMVPKKGFIEVYQTKDEGVGSIAIVVHPDYRSQGVGTKLVNDAKSNMKKLNLKRLEWYCKKSDEASVKLAKKCGFKVDENANWYDKNWYVLYYGEKVVRESVLDEWSMAACNPIIGVHKPFILKIGLDSGSVINTKQYAFSPDIISDKYLVVNEDAHFSIVDQSYFDDKVIESIYEYKGNRLFKLAEAYKNNSIVDNTVFYTALTGKPMLTEDQIDFDSNFSKVDISRYEQEVLTDLATNKDAYLETVGRGSEYNAPVLEEAYIDKIPYVNTYHRDDIVVKEDFDGYYFYNTITKRRTSSVGTITNLTETMLKTVM